MKGERAALARSCPQIAQEHALLLWSLQVFFDVRRIRRDIAAVALWDEFSSQDQTPTDNAAPKDTGANDRPIASIKLRFRSGKEVLG
jgi:hypothetical protein